MIEPRLGPGWGLARNLAFIQPVRWTIFGVLGEGSSRGPGFYAWVVRMPLYVPRSTLALTWSDRIGGGAACYEFDTAEGESAVDQAVAQARVDARSWSLQCAAHDATASVIEEEELAYEHVIQGDVDRATQHLARVVSAAVTRDWEAELVGRAQAVLALVERDDLPLAADLIGTWRTSTLQALGIPSSAWAREDSRG